MGQEEEYFHQIGSDIDGAEKSQLFGKPCYKIGGKAFCCYFQDAMVFKLSGDHHQEAINIKNAILFDPSNKNRPMKEWVQIPYDEHQQWKKFANAARKYVSAK